MKRNHSLPWLGMLLLQSTCGAIIGIGVDRSLYGHLAGDGATNDLRSVAFIMLGALAGVLVTVALRAIVNRYRKFSGLD